MFMPFEELKTLIEWNRKIAREERELEAADTLVSIAADLPCDTSQSLSEMQDWEAEFDEI
jgi:hypothetical protein